MLLEKPGLRLCLGALATRARRERRDRPWGRIFASRSAEPTARALTWLMNPSRAPGIPMAPGRVHPGGGSQLGREHRNDQGIWRWAMTVRLDHTIVPAKDKIASAGFFAEIFGLTVKPGQ